MVDVAARDVAVIRTRLLATKCLGHLFQTLLSRTDEVYSAEERSALSEGIQSLLDYHLKSKSAVQKFATALTIMEMRNYSDNVASLMVHCFSLSTSSCKFDEM